MKRLLPVLMGFAFLLLSSTEGWSLPRCPGSPLTGSISDVRLWDYCSGNLLFGPNTNWAGYKLIGEFRDGKPHGQGTGTWSAPHRFAGKKYVGEFRDGKYHGQGIRTFADGRVQEGIWENNKFQYAQKVTPTVTARKTPPPSPSAAEIENERLRRENARLKEEKKQKPKPAKQGDASTA